VPERPRDRSLRERPDRVALWAVVLAFAAMVAAAASASAQDSGGVGTGGGDSAGTSSGCSSTEFGKRTLALGDCGKDVKTLNWILNSKPVQRLDRSAPLHRAYESNTEQTVRTFEKATGQTTNGVVEKQTRSALIRKAMPKSVATWYGPGFWGNRTACGKRLKRKTVGVAHKRLPCGSRVVVRYKGNWLRTRVIDRGPYAHGAKWDLTRKAARKLDFTVTDKVRVAKLPKR
jgi:rare lipoprotein A (peptidoglycan hydrolase)